MSYLYRHLGLRSQPLQSAHPYTSMVLGIAALLFALRPDVAKFPPIMTDIVMLILKDLVCHVVILPNIFLIGTGFPLPMLLEFNITGNLMSFQIQQIFAGLVKCADCGWTLRYSRNNAAKTPYSYLSCSYYGQFGKGYCSMHYIRYDVLYAYVLSRLQYWSQEAVQDEGNLLHRLLKTGDRERAATKKKAAFELKKAEKRQREIDPLFMKMYEDRAAEKWIALIKQYANPTELTAELLNTLIEKIIVHDAVVNADGEREQEVEIYYRFIGKID